MTKKVDLGEIKFDSQKAAIEFFKSILNTGEIGRILDEEETKTLTCLLNLHPRWSEKVGAGIESIKIDLSDYPYENQCFVINRVDATSVDFSYLKCIKGDHNPSFPIQSSKTRKKWYLKNSKKINQIISAC